MTDKIADKLLALINSQPRTPTREQIVALLKEAQQPNDGLCLCRCGSIGHELRHEWEQWERALKDAIRGMSAPPSWRKE